MGHTEQHGLDGPVIGGRHGGNPLTFSDPGGQTSEVRSVIWGGDVQGTSLTFTIKDTPESNQPVADVYVILHGTDGKSVERFIKTTADGIADFGDIGRQRATVTLAYTEESTDPFFDQTSRNLETFVDVLVGEIVYYIDDSISYSYCDISDTTINATLAWNGGVPADIGWISLSPFRNTSSQDNVNFSSITVCPEHIQDDGNISILSQAYRETEQQELFRYGFLTDQALVNNGTYEIPMDRTPLETTWSTEPATPMVGVSIEGSRKGIDYKIGGSHQQSPTTFGLMPVLNEFPVENYWVSAYSGNTDNTSLYTRKKYEAIPSYIEIPVPDFEFDALNYDSSTRTFSWNLLGTADRDVMNIWFDHDSSYFDSENGVYINATTYWDVGMDQDRSQWALVDLPAEIASWVDLQQVNEYTVSTYDTDVFSGFDSVWYAHINGVDPEQESKRMFSASRTGFNPDRLKKRAQEKPASAEDDTKPSFRNPLKGLNRN